MAELKGYIRNFIRSVGQGIVLASLVCTIPAYGQDQSTAPAIAPFADELLRELGQYLDSADQYTFRVETEIDELSPQGQKIQYASSLDIAVQGSSRLFVDQIGDLHNRTLWFDGDRFTLLDQNLNHYVSVDTPNTLLEALPFLESRGIILPLTDFVSGNFYQGVTANVQTGDYLGLHQVGEELCHHFAFTQANVDWQLWIKDGFQVVPCKLIITYKNLPQAPQYTAYFLDWDFSPRLPERLFRFVAPEGSSEIEFLPPR